MNPKILCLLFSIFTIVWATKTPQEKESGGPSRNQPKFNHSKQSAFHKVVPKSSKQSDKIKTNEVEADQSKQSDKIKTNEVEADQSKQSDKIKTNEVGADQSKQSDKIKTNEVEADQSKQSDKIKTNEVEADQSKQSKIETNEVKADQSKQSDKIETNEVKADQSKQSDIEKNEVKADQSKQSDKIETNEVKADQSKQSDIEKNEVEADQSKQSDKIETNEVEADQNQTDRMELSAEKSAHAQTPSNESSKRQPDKSGDEPNQFSEATLSVGENENEPGKRRRLANKQPMRQMDESIDGEVDEKMDAEMAGDAGPSDGRRKAVASTDRSINSEPPKNTENSSTPLMSHHQLESQIRQQSQQLIQLDQKMEKILRMLPEQQQRSQAQQQHHQQAQQEQQVHEPQQLPQPQSLQQQKSTWFQRNNRVSGGQSLQSSADAQQQSQVQNQFQQQAKLTNFLAQLQQHNQLQQPSQSQIQPTQLQPGSIQHSAQRQRQSPRSMAQHQLHPLAFLPTPMPQLQGSSLSMPQQRASSSSMPLLQQRPSSSSMPQSSLSMPRPSSSSMPQSSSSMPQSSLSMPRPSSSSMPLPQLQGSSSSMPQSSLSMPRPSSSSMPLPQLQGSSLSMAQQRPSSSSMPQLQGSSLSMAQQRTSSSSMPQLQGSSSSMPQLQGSSLSMAQQRTSSSSMPLLQQRPSSSSMPQLQGSSLSMPQQRPSLLSMPQQWPSSSSSMLQQQLLHQLHHSQTVHELVKQKQQELPIPPVVGGILESSATNSMQQPVDKGKQHSATFGAVGQLPTPTSAPSFALPGISDQMLAVNLAVNEAGTSNNAEQTAVSLHKQYLMIVEAIVKRAAMKSILIIQLLLKNYGDDEHPALVGLNFMNAEANKLAMAIDVVKVAETNTAQFVINQMKKGNADAQITQILEEIGEECADFERHMKARTANWEVAKNQKMLRENNFLFAFGRLYYKLFFLLTTAFGPNVLQQESDVKKLLVWTDTMRKEIFKNSKNSEAQNPEASKWCESLFQLEMTNDLAKLAIVIAFPPNSLNAWVSSGRNWPMLKEMLNQIKLDEFLAHFDDKSWNRSNYMGLIRKLTGYAAENNAMFNSLVVCKLTALLDIIVARINSLIPRQDMREAANLNNLVLFSALFRKLIADFETPNNDVIRLAKLREESKSAQNILELCLSMLDAKFNEFKKNVLDTINAMDVIRKGITEDDEGANAQSK